jgi:TolB-like protein/Flp pilus assembly protein TadD
MSESGKAVFLSYASQDAEAAKRICEALRTAGVEVWFDQSELVGGDAWDTKIRGQISTCTLFVPIISAATQARGEGYFRLEWKLAVDRSHLMAHDQPFLLPIVIDATPDSAARVPPEFRAVQWTRLPGGETPGKFREQVKKLLDPAAPGLRPDAERNAPSAPKPRGKLPGLLPVALGLGVLATILAVWAPWKKPTPNGTPPTESPKVSEARALSLRASALLADPMLVKESVTAAEELCARAVAIDPQDGEAWAVYALVATAFAGEFGDDSSVQKENARSRAERAIRLAPDSVNAALAMAEFEFFADYNFKAADVRLRALLARVPDDKRIAHILAWSLAVQGRSEESFAVLDTAARRPGGNYLALARKGWGLLHSDRWGEVEAAFNASLALQPNRDALHGKLLYLINCLGDLARARALLESLPSGQLREDRVAYLAYQMWMRLRQPDQAAEALRRISHDFIQEGRITMPTRFGLAEAQQLAGRPQAALVEWESALATVDQRLKAEPADESLVRWRTLLLARLGRKADAERAFGLWLELAGIRVDEIQKMDADLLLALGREDDALTVIRHRMGPGENFSPTFFLRLRDEPTFDPLRARPEFAAALKEGEIHQQEFFARVGLPPSPPAGSAVVPPAPDDKSVAVLAFTNLSDDKANEYFSDGISEELLNVVAKIPGLKVTARTSSFYFKGKDLPIADIAHQLGVAYVVEGSVQKAGDRVRITAQLIKAADGFQVWSDRFDRDLKDIFAVQDEIAGVIARNLSLKLGASSPAATEAVDPRAFELYVQGRQAWNLRTAEGFTRAEQLLSQALSLAPDFMRARAALIDVALGRLNKQLSFGRRQTPELASLVAQCEGLLALDPDLAETHASLGLALMLGWDIVGAEREFRQATKLNPNYASGRQWLGLALLGLGKVDEGVAELKLAAELDPFSPIILDNYGAALWLTGRFREAVDFEDRALALHPGWEQALAHKARELGSLGRFPEAIALAGQLPVQETDDRVMILALSGREVEAEAWLTKRSPAETGHRSRLLLAVGRREEARASRADPAPVGQIEFVVFFYEPEFDAIRSDPRFLKFLGTLGWVEAHARVQAWRAAHPPEKPEGAK